YVALKLNGEAGEVAEHVGKAIRDEGFLNDPGLTGKFLADEEMVASRRDSVIKELGDVLWYIAAAASELGISLDEVAEMNIAKLNDRKERGVLGGSGDNR